MSLVLSIYWGLIVFYLFFHLKLPLTGFPLIFPALGRLHISRTEQLDRNDMHVVIVSSVP